MRRIGNENQKMLEDYLKDRNGPVTRRGLVEATGLAGTTISRAMERIGWERTGTGPRNFAWVSPGTAPKTTKPKYLKATPKEVVETTKEKESWSLDLAKMKLKQVGNLQNEL